MKTFSVIFILSIFYLNAYSQTIKLIALDSEDNASVLLTEKNIANVTIDSSCIILKLKPNINTEQKIDSTSQTLLFFSFDCYCTIEVRLLHDTFCCRFQQLYIRYNDEYLITQNGEIKIWHGHLRITKEEREEIFTVFKKFTKR